MKIAFTTSGNDNNAPLNSRFGRAVKFLVYDLDTETFNVVDNQKNVNASHGAGIKIYNTSAHTVAKALAQYRAGKLNAANAADVGGHWS